MAVTLEKLENLRAYIYSPLAEDSIRLFSLNDDTSDAFSAQAIRSTSGTRKWEAILALGAAVSFTALVIYLRLQGQPIADPSVGLLLRILLSLCLAAFGATIPGTLTLGRTRTGLLIRVVGALVLFVLAFFVSPALVKGHF